MPAADPDEAEVVEHKGLGHPDSICDAVAEAFALSLLRHYQDRCGRVLHFNVDKALLVGGVSRPAFGGGDVIEPIRLILGGRATDRVGDTRIPVESIGVESGKAWVRDHLHALDPDQHVRWSCLTHTGSAELADLFSAGAGGGYLANDTSIGVGYAPRSPLERAVLACSARLVDLAAMRPEIGEDTKLMATRRRDRVEVTVACALVGRHLADLEAYRAARELVRDEVRRTFASSLAEGEEALLDEAGVAVQVNAADDLSTGRIFLTVTGTSAEAGDDGEVGRGNRVGGLITPFRPMSLEAAAGKNPFSHVGKLYNVLAQRAAEAVVASDPRITDAHCTLVSRIGGPVADPALVDVALRVRDDRAFGELGRAAHRIVEGILEDWRASVDDLVRGRIRLF